MKEIKAIINAYNSIDFTQTKAALATVARVEGSSYRRTGARMLVLDNGTYLGGISGGCLEGDALRRAQKAIAQNKPSVITYDTTQDDGAQIGVGLGCNGIIDVLFTPLQPDVYNPVNLLSSITGTRKPRVVVSITGGDITDGILGRALLYENDESFFQQFSVAPVADTVLTDIKNALENQASVTRNYSYGGNTVKIFIEVVQPVTQLVLYGSNYDIHTMARIAGELGWSTTVVTNIHKADKALFTTATHVLHNKGGEEPAIDAYTAVVLMAHDYKADFNNLQAVLTTNAKYIGLLGPRKRSVKMFDTLQQQDRPVSSADMQRIYSPAGLDIGAATPEEIAVSIVAEIRSCFAGRKGASLRLREGTIYGN
ncbi:XdhC family protein [Foetidibacter luteolus]|uniref:XdhC family protein n=1 Tax=Foetidibacter luteolus TaxID=2608880 RepID=UPI00129B6804|nr:XdhC family protein [Foetidibacter luteolus]